MTCRMSSGSSSAEIAVDPTKSQNITVSCRRWASSRRGSDSLLWRAGAVAWSSAIALRTYEPAY